MKTYSDLSFEYKEQRDLLFQYMKSINDVEQIRMLSNEIMNIDKKIVEINKLSQYMQSSFVLYREQTFESKINNK